MYYNPQFPAAMAMQISASSSLSSSSFAFSYQPYRELGLRLLFRRNVLPLTGIRFQVEDEQGAINTYDVKFDDDTVNRQREAMENYWKEKYWPHVLAQLQGREHQIGQQSSIADIIEGAVKLLEHEIRLLVLGCIRKKYQHKLAEKNQHNLWHREIDPVQYLPEFESNFGMKSRLDAKIMLDLLSIEELRPMVKSSTNCEGLTVKKRHFTSKRTQRCKIKSNPGIC
ncbi:hypothetical protein DFH27DRAFT_529448 [Peziza echinospora]|nr:hypothetical protein DFH27DRAFT_529448 [Peziza echinospora]